MFLDPTSHQIALVRAHLPALQSQADAAAGIFFRAVFQADPGLQSLWTGEGVAQSSKLIEDLTRAVEVIETAPALRAFLAELAWRERRGGLTPRGYFAIHSALMDMIAAHLEADRATYDAWDAVITKILATMLDAAHGPRAFIRALPMAA